MVSKILSLHIFWQFFFGFKKKNERERKKNDFNNNKIYKKKSRLKQRLKRVKIKYNYFRNALATSACNASISNNRGSLVMSN